jgi:transglutaminase-like putative cysteine protease
MKKIALLATIVLFISLAGIYAQKQKIKFGSVPKSDLEMTKYDLDTSAGAVILSDIGKSWFDYLQDKGFQIVFTRHVRIKILDKREYDWADGEIAVYHSNNNEEKVIQLKGITFNLENGKIVKSKLDKNSKFTEKKNDYWNIEKFTMPNVKEGSVLDILYSVKSDFPFNFREWYFQYSIPVIYSEYTTFIPEYYSYKILTKGYHNVNLAENKSYPGNITLTSKSRSSGNVTQTSFNQNTISFTNYTKVWIAENVPALKSEPYMTTIDNYRTAIEFELRRIDVPGFYYKDYTKDWETINKELLDHEYFGKQLERKGLVKDIADEISSRYKSEQEKMIAALEYVKDNVKWNNLHSIFSSRSLKNALDNHSGNCADINLLLVLLLKELGIDSEPLILSTRENGIIHPAQLMISKFNYLVAYAKIGSKEYLLDATEEKCPFYMLPKRCINGSGRLVRTENSDWIDLKTDMPYKYASIAILTINNDGELEGSITKIRENYAALDLRKGIAAETSQDKFIENLENDFKGLDITKFEFINLDSIYKPISERYEVAISDYIEEAGNLLYFNPLLEERIKENPFKLEDRKFPVDYGYPHEYKYTLQFIIPEGYTVDEVPESIKLTLPDKAAEFKYSAIQQDNSIQIGTELIIKKSQFVQTEYSRLKEFYDKVIAKQGEHIVLKKI